MTVLTTTAPTIGPLGCSVPAFADIIDTLTTQYIAIYGSDTYLGNDSQDAQWIAVQATSINDNNAAILAAYNAFSPTTAQGNGLSSVVKTNGLRREISSNSQADITLVGTVGYSITNGIVSDGTYQWLLPAFVQFPNSGSITVTATCATMGAISAAPNTITTMTTPTRGWNSATNASSASVGAPIEMDGALRQRQSISTALPALATADTILGTVLSLPGVQSATITVNNTAATDAHGIPSHSFSVVVQGGNAQAIANAIGLKKSPGSGTFGTSSATYTSPAGIAEVIQFYRPTVVVIAVAINISVFATYTSLVGNELIAAVAAYINSLPIGAPLYWTRLLGPANLTGSGTDGVTYEVNNLGIARSPGTPVSANIAALFTEVLQTTTANITLTIS